MTVQYPKWAFVTSQVTTVLQFICKWPFWWLWSNGALCLLKIRRVFFWGECFVAERFSPFCGCVIRQRCSELHLVPVIVRTIQYYPAVSSEYCILVHPFLIITSFPCLFPTVPHSSEIMEHQHWPTAICDPQRCKSAWPNDSWAVSLPLPKLSVWGHPVNLYVF